MWLMNLWIYTNKPGNSMLLGTRNKIWERDELKKELAASRAEKEKRKSTNSRTFKIEKYNNF